MDHLHADEPRHAIDLLGVPIIACSYSPMLGLPPMCGRFTQTASPAVIAQQFGVAAPTLFTPRATN